MYINEKKIRLSKIINGILLAVGIIGLILFGGTSIFLLIQELDAKRSIIELVILTVINGVVIFISFIKRKIIDDIYFYSRYFEGDLSGYINTSSMVNVIGKSEKRINFDLKMLLKIGYMKNYTLNKNKDGVQITLSSTISKCECKNCGAIITKREDFTGVCPYCGSSDLFAKKIEQEMK